MHPLGSLSLACQLSCAIGIPNKDCTGCICPNHTLLGNVRRADGMPLANAQISLAGQPLEPLAQSNRWGQFTIRGICAGNSTDVIAKLERFAPGSASTVINGSGTSLVEIILQRLGKC